jgi:hypothetical protein
MVKILAFAKINCCHLPPTTIIKEIVLVICIIIILFGEEKIQKNLDMKFLFHDENKAVFDLKKKKSSSSQIYLSRNISISRH